MDYYYNSIPSRTICAVLEEMRACYKTRNFAALAGLVEEVQSLANRMESGLEDQHDVERLRDQKGKLKAEIKKLEKQKELLDEKA